MFEKSALRIIRWTRAIGLCPILDTARVWNSKGVGPILFEVAGSRNYQSSLKASNLLMEINRVEKSA